MPNTHPDFPIGLEESVKNNLNSLDECDSFLQEAVGEKSSKSWVVADTFLHIRDKFGKESLAPIASRHGFSSSTAYSYSRVARAFPVDLRVPSVSFTHHLVAMKADKYDRATEEFLTFKRFGWLGKAAEDSSLKPRDILYQITQEQEKETLQVEALPCNKCKSGEGEIKLYVMFAPRTKQRRDQFYLHQECYEKVKEFINT